MKKFLLRTGAALIAASMLFSLAACNKKGGSGEKSHSGTKVTADMPWFNSEIIDCDFGVDKSRETEYIYSSLAGADDKYIAILTYGNYKTPSDVDWENFDYSDYQINILTILDKETHNVVKSYDGSTYFSGNVFVNDAFYHDGKVTLVLNSWDEKTGSQENYELDIDIETGEELDKREVSEDTYQVARPFKVGDYEVKLLPHWEEKSYYTVEVISPDGSSKDFEVKEGKMDIYQISTIFPLSDTKVVLPAETNEGALYFEIDLKSGTMTKADEKEYDWIDSNFIYNAFLGSDGNVYCSSPVGISKIDLQKKVTEEVFNYSWCGVSRNLLTNMEIADINEDSFVLAGEFYTKTPYVGSYNYTGSDYHIITFKKADKNPHTGKTILELYASYGYTDDVVSDAIAKYNDTNDNYFIEVRDRYSDAAEYNYNNLKNDDDMQTAELNYIKDMSNKLAMDVMNGDGPDMFLDVSYYGQLNSSNYLADLTPYVANLDSSKYFTNVIELSKVDGKLFNLPISFCVEGIHTDNKYAGASGIGFTTDEYKDFLNNVLNGEDVITVGQAHYFAKLFDGMSDKFISNGKADFSGPEFAALAEFVKDNVNEVSKDWDDEDGVMGGVIVENVYPGMESEVKKAIYTSSYGYGDYLQILDQLDGAQGILGIPSADGRGPMISSYTSIAVSAQACNIDACGEFVKLLVSDEIQNDLAEAGQFVLNREAFRKAGEGAVEYFNKHSVQGMYYYGLDESELPSNRVKYTTEHVDILENTILNCSKMYSQDSGIDLILVEEMPAYFSGQKSLDEVVKVAQDRVQKVLDERG